MEYMTTQETAKLWNITIRRVQAMCEKGLISNAGIIGQIWVIPKGTPKPIDGRTKAARICRSTVNKTAKSIIQTKGEG